MIGSFGPKPEPQSATFITEESPSGLIARSGTYNVSSRIYDDDGKTHAGVFLRHCLLLLDLMNLFCPAFDWCFKLAKEW